MYAILIPRLALAANGEYYLTTQPELVRTDTYSDAMQAIDRIISEALYQGLPYPTVHR